MGYNSPKTLICDGLGPGRKAIKNETIQFLHGPRSVAHGEGKDCLPPSRPNPTPQHGTLPVAPSFLRTFPRWDRGWWTHFT